MYITDLKKERKLMHSVYVDGEFWATYIFTLGEAFTPMGEPKVMFFTYWA